MTNFNNFINSHEDISSDELKSMYGKASNLLDQMQEWEMNDFESFEKNDCAIVRIHAKGQLVQEEYGLSDNESTYKGIEFSFFTID